MEALRELAEQLGWQVWTYKTIRVPNEDVTKPAEIQEVDPFYILRSPIGLPFVNGEPVTTTRYIEALGDLDTLVDGRLYRVPFRYSEEEAWQDLPKDEAVLRRTSRWWAMYTDDMMQAGIAARQSVINRLVKKKSSELSQRDVKLWSNYAEDIRTMSAELTLRRQETPDVQLR